VAEPDILIRCDQLARRYRVLPHEIRRLSPEDLAFAIACRDEAVASLEQAITMAEHKPQTVIVAGEW
jgi:hypothetical protein